MTWWGWGYPTQKWLKLHIYPVKKGKDILVMIWGAIWIGGRLDVVFIERDIEAPRGGYSAWSYLKVLKEQLPSFYQPPIEFI